MTFDLDLDLDLGLTTIQNNFQVSLLTYSLRTGPGQSPRHLGSVCGCCCLGIGGLQLHLLVTLSQVKHLQYGGDQMNGMVT